MFQRKILTLEATIPSDISVHTSNLRGHAALPWPSVPLHTRFRTIRCLSLSLATA
jgi:hypothetical protein